MGVFHFVPFVFGKNQSSQTLEYPSHFCNFQFIIRLLFTLSVSQISVHYRGKAMPCPTIQTRSSDELSKCVHSLIVC